MVNRKGETAMIGMIVTGHGHFATGVMSTIKLLSGEHEKLIGVDFEEGMTAEQLQAKFQDAVKALGDVSGIAFFTDIPGGTPFNQAVMCKMNYDNVAVLSGTNVSMLMEIMFQRELDIEQFADAALTAGKSGVVQFKQRVHEDNDEEDGI